MSFNRGEIGNAAGRPKGVRNKLTRELRDVLKGIISNEPEWLSETLEQLQPKERIELVIKLAAFVLPKVEPLNCHYDLPLSDW